MQHAPRVVLPLLPMTAAGKSQFRSEPIVSAICRAATEAEIVSPTMPPKRVPKRVPSCDGPTGPEATSGDLRILIVDKYHLLCATAMEIVATVSEDMAFDGATWLVIVVMKMVVSMCSVYDSKIVFSTKRETQGDVNRFDIELNKRAKKMGGEVDFKR